jgi:hypothetical protein
MPADTVTGAERVPRPGRYLIPGDIPRRGEFIAVCGVLAVVAHLLFAQLTLILAVVFVIITRLSRWRPVWLAVPAAIGLVWVLAIGPVAAAEGFWQGPAQIAAYLGGVGQHPGRLGHLGTAYAGIGHWLPRQFPLALILAAAEAACAAWLTWLHTDEWKLPGYRPGLITWCRRAYLTRLVSSGGVVTRDGACLGLNAATGGQVAVSWAEGSGGLLCAGSPGSGTTSTSFQIVQAAIRRRKPVIAVDLDGSRKLAESFGALCEATGAPLYRLPGEASRYYDPLRTGEPARRTSLVMGMVDWTGTSDQYRRSCAAYLTDLFAVADAAPGDPRTPMLDEVVHLLNPAALRARVEHVPGYHPRRQALGERVKVSAGLLEGDPRITAALAEQLNELRASPLGRWLAPAPGAPADLGRVVRERAVALFSIDAAVYGRAATTLASLVARDVLAVCSELRRIGVPGDGLAWFDQCGGLAPAALSDLVARGEAAGLPALLTTTEATRVQALADQVNVLALHRLTDPAVAERFAGLTGEKLAPPGEGDFPAAGGPPVRAKATAGARATTPAAAVGAAGPTDPAGPLSQLGPYGLVRKPVVAARSLSRLGNGEHVLIVRRPRRRLVTLGLTVPARMVRHPRPLSARQAARTGADPAAPAAADQETSAGSRQKGRRR